MSYIPYVLEFKKQINATIEVAKRFIRIDELTDEELQGMLYIYPKWDSFIGKEIDEEKLVRYKDSLYKSLKKHIVLENLNPVDANYLFVKVGFKDVIAEWEQRDYRNPYLIGDRVLWLGKVYELILGGNAYSYNPIAYPQGWKEIV